MAKSTRKGRDVYAESTGWKAPGQGKKAYDAWVQMNPDARSGGKMVVAEGATPLTAKLRVALGLGKEYKLSRAEVNQMFTDRSRASSRSEFQKNKQKTRKAEGQKLNPDKTTQKTGISRSTAKKISEKKIATPSAKTSSTKKK